MSLREYIGRFRPAPGAAASLESRESEVGYLRGWFFESTNPELLQDFTPPAWAGDMFEKLPASARPPFHWIFCGPKGSSTPCHVDPLLTHAWLAQIVGRKRFLLRPPSALPALVRPPPQRGFCEGGAAVPCVEALLEV